MHLETIHCHINLAADHTCILGGQLFFLRAGGQPPNRHNHAYILTT